MLAELGAEAAIVKSGVTVTEIAGVFVRDKGPLTPVIETVYELAGVKTVVKIVRVSVDVDPGVRSTLDALRVTVNPAAWGETVAARLTVPAKPLLVTLIAEVACPPATKPGGLG
ncbi:MAG TPA: hypothetical protein VE177_02735 [Candidatus Binatus sp.]|jgi:hypothetical protein|nr:hypothetical protein [Candidatus Binatus sp.]